MRRFGWLLLYLCICLTARAADKVRTWTNLQGLTMQAEFLREVDGDATFLKDGKLLTIPLDQLSDHDRQVIRELEAAKAAGPSATNAEPDAGSPFKPVDPTRTPRGDDRFLQPQKKKPAIVDRTWTNNQGTQVNARFVRVHGPNVVVMRGARTITLPFDSLSAADQDYVRDVLVSRGEESKLPGATAPVAEGTQPGGSPAFAEPAAAAIAPPTPPEPKDDGATIGRGNSAFFDQMRERNERTRQQQAEHAVEAGQRPVEPAPGQTNGEPPAQEAQAAESSRSAPGSAAAGRTSHVHTTLDPQQARDVRGAVIIVVVAVGVIGTVGLIVFIAISIAAANTASRNRRYTA